jgi:DeoR/GlpR family transcriptional regulator of sugar metabolism
MLKRHELFKMTTMDQGPIGITISQEMIDLSAESIIVADNENEEKYNRSKLSNFKKVPPL